MVWEYGEGLVVRIYGGFLGPCLGAFGCCFNRVGEMENVEGFEGWIEENLIMSSKFGI